MEHRQYAIRRLTETLPDNYLTRAVYIPVSDPVEPVMIVLLSGFVRACIHQSFYELVPVFYVRYQAILEHRVRYL